MGFSGVVNSFFDAGIPDAFSLSYCAGICKDSLRLMRTRRLSIHTHHRILFIYLFPFPFKAIFRGFSQIGGDCLGLVLSDFWDHEGFRLIEVVKDFQLLQT